MVQHHDGRGSWNCDYCNGYGSRVNQIYKHKDHGDKYDYCEDCYDLFNAKGLIDKINEILDEQRQDKERFE